jgi:hypothetical protein
MHGLDSPSVGMMLRGEWRSKRKLLFLQQKKLCT